MAKKKSATLPKKIAGVKIPKTFRKPGKKLKVMTASPFAREIVAAALVATAGAIASNRRFRDKAVDLGRKAYAGAADGIDSVKPATKPKRKRASPSASAP